MTISPVTSPPAAWLSCARGALVAVLVTSSPRCPKLVSHSMQFVASSRGHTVRTVKGAPMSDGEDRPDGRRTRGRQTQERIVDALLTLIEAGDPAPANARIADQAGISARLVYHHFQDLEELFGVAVERRSEERRVGKECRCGGAP